MPGVAYVITPPSGALRHMPLILLHGDNLIELEDALREMRASFNPADVVAFDGSSGSLVPAADASRTAGLFDPERLVVIENVHQRTKGTKKDAALDEIRDLVTDIAPTTTLLLLGRDMLGDHPLVQIVKAAGGRVRTFMAPRKGELSRWILERAKREGVSIRPDAADLLAELAGGNPVLLQSELAKLATYTGPGGTISTEAVDLLVGAVPQESIFALVDAVAAGNQRQAFRLLRAQIAGASSTPMDVALYVIRMLARQMRILMRIKLGTEAGKSQSVLTDELRLSHYFADRYFRQAQRLQKHRLAASFEQLAGLEYALKTGKADPATGLDLLITKLCT